MEKHFPWQKESVLTWTSTCHAAVGFPLGIKSAITPRHRYTTLFRVNEEKQWRFSPGQHINLTCHCFRLFFDVRHRKMTWRKVRYLQMRQSKCAKKGPGSFGREPFATSGLRFVAMGILTNTKSCVEAMVQSAAWVCVDHKPGVHEMGGQRDLDQQSIQRTMEV